MKLIYEIARPSCPFVEVQRHLYYNPPQAAWPPKVVYRKRILVLATDEQILDAETEDDARRALDAS